MAKTETFKPPVAFDSKRVGEKPQHVSKGNPTAGKKSTKSSAPKK